MQLGIRSFFCVCDKYVRIMLISFICVQCFNAIIQVENNRKDDRFEEKINIVFDSLFNYF